MDDFYDEVTDYLTRLRESKGITIKEMESKNFSWYRCECQDSKLSEQNINYIANFEKDDEKRKKIQNDLLSIYKKYNSNTREKATNNRTVVSNNSIKANEKPIWLKKGSDWKH